MKVFEQMLQKWQHGAEDEEMHSTCVVSCMDFRHHGVFHGAYNAGSAGPRYADSIRSVEAFLRLKAGVTHFRSLSEQEWRTAFERIAASSHTLRLLWATHTAGCGCSKLETESTDLAVIERHTTETRRAEVAKLLAHPAVHTAIATGAAKFLVAEVRMDSSGWTELVQLQDETNNLLAAAGLPTLS